MSLSPTSLARRSMNHPLRSVCAAASLAAALALSCGDSGRDSFGPGGPLVEPPEASETKNCVDAFAETKRAVDIIVSIDQSGSMREEVESLNTNINLLPSLLAASGLDYRVVMVAEVGRNDFQVCVPPPLGVDCKDNPGVFRAVDQRVESNDSLSLLLKTFDYPVPRLAWRDFLRPSVLKVFVPITDDEATDIDADGFDSELRRRGDPLFGSADDPNYVFFPIIGMSDYPDTTPCPTAVAPGLQYQRLSSRTKGRWFSVCRPSLATVLETIGKAVEEAVSCEVAIPEPPSGATLDLTKINVQIAQGGGSPVVVPQDPDKPCNDGADGWQFSGDKKKIVLCGATCDAARADPTTKFSVGFSCNTIVR